MLPLPLAIVHHLILKMKRNFLRLLVILLVFSYVLSVSAIPATRTQNLKGEEDISALPLLPQLEDAVKLENGEEVVADMDEGLFMERRIDLETQDYGGTGANSDHEPRSPGSLEDQNIN